MEIEQIDTGRRCSMPSLWDISGIPVIAALNP
jgi:hypothetical protein